MWLLAGGHFLKFCLTFSFLTILFAICYEPAISFEEGLCVVKVEGVKQESSGLLSDDLVGSPWGSFSICFTNPTVHLAWNLHNVHGT